MNQVMVGAIQINAATCGGGAPRLLFQRNRLDRHCTQTCNEKCRAKPLTIYFPVYLLRRLFNPQIFKHPRELFVSDATAMHFELNELFCKLFPRLIWLCTLAFIEQSVHCSPTKVTAPILGRIRLNLNRKHYTSQEITFVWEFLLMQITVAKVGITLNTHAPENAG